MDQGLELRLHKVVERRIHDREAEVQFETADQNVLRAAHDRVVGEIPAALTRLSNAIEEINDAVSDAGIHLRLAPAEEPYTITASFHVLIWPSDDNEKGLMFNVNHDGKLIVLLASHQSRTRLKSIDIWDADRRFLLDALVSLLEAMA